MRWVQAAIVAVSMVWAGQSVAQGYPEKPIQIVVPFAPGGSTDILARIVAEKLTAKWGKQVVVDNRTGGAGILGVNSVISARPDGYTLLVGTNGELTVSPSLYKSATYDATKNLKPVTMLGRNAFVIAASNRSGFTSIQDLIKRAKEKPRTITYGSGGAGSTNHITGALFAKAAGIELNHIPYKGAGPVAVAVAGGEVDVAFLSPAAVAPHVDAGNMKPLGVTSKGRQAFAPNWPTANESGVPGFDVDAWIGMLAPAGTPDDIVNKLNAAVREILADPALVERLGKLGLVGAGMDSDAFRRILVANRQDYAKVVQEFGITADE